MSLLLPAMPLSTMGMRVVLRLKRALLLRHPVGVQFTIETVRPTFPTTVVEVVTMRLLDQEAAKTLVRYIWKCRADPSLAVRAVDARGQERFRFDAAGAWTLHPERPLTRIVPVGLRRSIHRLPDPSA